MCIEKPALLPSFIAKALIIQFCQSYRCLTDTRYPWHWCSGVYNYGYSPGALTLHPCAPWIVGFPILEWDSSDFVALVHFEKLEHENNLDITKTRILYFTRCFAWFIRITIN